MRWMIVQQYAVGQIPIIRNHVPNRAALIQEGVTANSVARNHKLKKQRDNKPLASVKKEMARPRFVESARKEEEEANHCVMRHDSFMNT